MATSMKVIVFWNTTPCSLVEVNRSLRDPYDLQHNGDCRVMSRDLDSSLLLELTEYAEPAPEIQCIYFRSLKAV
jgi:hypothetical protein